MKMNGMQQHASFNWKQSAFVDVLVSESSLHRGFQLHNIYIVCNELQICTWKYQQHHSIENRVHLSMSWHRNRVCTGAFSYTITTAYAMSYEHTWKNKQKQQETTQGAWWKWMECNSMHHSIENRAHLHWAFCFTISTSYAMSYKYAHERINRNNRKLKELDKNEWNATTCIIPLKTTFVDVLASESGLHWRFELHNNYSVCFELQTHERINNRNSKKLKELDRMAGIRCIIH